MKLKKLVRKLEEFLDADARERLKHREDMKTLLRKMKVKEKNLAAKALVEFDQGKLERLRKEIDLVHAQRKKGISALKEMYEQAESDD